LIGFGADAGNNAERAPVVASILHLQVGTRFFGDGIAGENRGSDEFSMSKNIAYQRESRWQRGQQFPERQNSAVGRSAHHDRFVEPELAD